MPQTVYDESVRRLELMINIIGLRVICSQVPINIAQSMLSEYALTLRKLKLEFGYSGEDNAAYRKCLLSEFILGDDPMDIDYDLALAPSNISHLEATSLMAERAQLILQSEQYSGEVY